MRMTICFLMCSIFSFAQQETPVLTNIVTDYSGIFIENEQGFLIDKLADFENETTVQIVVLIIDSLENETIERYALKVFDNNKIGQKDTDNGILMLVSKLDKKVRIEVGYGLEPTITDAVASRIIREIMIPNFKKEKYFDGIYGGVTKIMELIGKPKSIQEPVKNKESSTPGVTIFGRILGAIFLTPIFLLIIIFGYNLVVARDKKTSISKLYKTNKSVIFLAMFIVACFVEFIFTSLFYLFFFGIIFFIILSLSFTLITRVKNSYKTKSTSISSKGSSSYNSGEDSFEEDSFDDDSYEDDSSDEESFTGGGGSSGGGGASGSW